MQKAVIVVPCYNEASRLREQDFLPLLEPAALELCFVNDGSSDETGELLQAMARRHGRRVHVLELARNGGKAEAVRRGMLHALAHGAEVVGYMDADASTPAHEMLRLLNELDSRGATVVLGARVRLLGNEVRRRAIRHYLGRIFASVASLLLSLPVYDTQCGAKLFRANPTLSAALRDPFASRWVFDVELIGRLLLGHGGTHPIPASAFLEVPLTEWSDVAGSKLGPTSMVRSGLELLRIGKNLQVSRRRRKR